MAKVPACPEGAQLRQLLAGLLADEQAASLEEHLAGCSCCSELVEGMVGEESLAHAVRSGMASLSEVDHPLVQNVIERLSKLPVGLVPVEHTAAVQTNDTETLSLSSMRAEQVHGLSDEDLEILAPPQGPNEMGRLGGYRILRVLGQGGMGIVYQAEDMQLRRLVALKVMRPKVANASARERFLHEARACAALKHDHIVSIYQVGEDRGVPFLAMEFLEGRSLDRCLEPGRPLTLPQVLRIGKELAQGLAAAHAKGLIHRDIKPANIWLDTDSGRVKILDFGLARSQADDVQLTASNTIVGTPSYMAPEQARGETVDGRCDLFSLGCVLYRLCTGKLPFAGTSTMAILLELATHTPRPVKEVNPEMPLALSQLIERLLAKEPKDRPSSAAQVVQALQQIEDDSPRNAPAPAVDKPRRGLLVAGVVGAVLTASVLVGVVLYRYLDGEPRQAAATGNGEGPRGAADSGSPPLTTASKPEPTEKVAPPKKAEPVVGAATKPPPIPPGASPFDTLRREDIPADELAAAGGGDPLQAPQELVAVLRQKALFNHQYPEIGFDLSPDGNTVAYNFGGPRVYLWDVPTRTERTLEMPRRAGAQARCPSLAFSPDGKKLAGTTGQSFGLIVVWDLDRGAIERELHVEKHGISSVAFSPDGRTLAAVYVDRQIRLWNGATGRQENALGEKVTGPIRFSPDGQLLATLSEGRLALYNPASGELLQHWFETPRDLCFRPDGRALAVVDSPQGTVKLLNSADGKELRTLLQRTGRAINSVTYAPNGKLLATREVVGAIWLWDADTGRERGRIDMKLKGKQAGLRFAPDGRHLLTANEDGTIYVLRLEEQALENRP